MSWNYRVVEKSPTFNGLNVPGITTYEIREVYYSDDDGSLVSITVDAVRPYGESLGELKNDLIKMLSALSHPVVREND